MSSGHSVPSLHSVSWDVSCSSPEEETSLRSPTSSSSPSSCQVSSSSTVQRFSSKKRNNKAQFKNRGFPSSDSYVEESHDIRSSHDEPIDSPSATMGLDTSSNYRNRNSHRRVSSPHPDGTVKKSNKPQMERRRRQRINDSVNELRKFILEVFKVDPSRLDKMEKADILELTVKYFHFIRSRSNVNDMNSENKPVRLERKIINGDYLTEERYAKCDRGIMDKKYNGINEQPVTLIIQTLPPNFQNHFAPRDQYVTGYNGNSVSAQPPVIPNQNTPVIQLNITNNISNPAATVDSYHSFPSQTLTADNFINSTSPDPSSNESQYDFVSEPCISFKEELNGYNIDPNRGLAEKKSLINPMKGYQLNRNDTSGRKISLGRPIAPKPQKKRENIEQMIKIPQPHQDGANEIEQVWRPWDANRKVLKPHMIQLQ